VNQELSLTVQDKTMETEKNAPVWANQQARTSSVVDVAPNFVVMSDSFVVCPMP
jgi:hypothetical protein